MSSVSARFDAGKAIAAGRAGAERGLGMAMEHLLGESRKQVPHEESTLERSGTAVVDGLEGAVYYDTVYARRQHEEETWRHDPGRKAKYLEDPAIAEKDTMLGLVAAQVRRALR
ncbi:hypothetical protein [Nocardiopsis tropica]|uniref:HK97 gp10 family phage protein n=1 Tax=Nocardiopsis tropica TaxID=109330 RepID=A0ABU7KNQ3_9ACTN|nr:hypothetical protein [Nocardiopsis umidischolae]MEE2050307.1 hypothetical protein [Nocardiopsis umidischolae]